MQAATSTAGGRNHRLAHGTVLRKVLLNSWEGVYFDINEEGMQQMMSDIADMGGELFVMDDGWFGQKYPRNNDSTSLGDWVVDTNKLSGGISASSTRPTNAAYVSAYGLNPK